MSAPHLETTDTGKAQTLGPVLRAAHDIWIREAGSFLSPIIRPGAPFWDRWTAVRYLADQFMSQYRRERALVDELRPFLPPETAERLIGDGDRILQLQEQLDEVGRRRGTARTVAAIGREVLRSLRSWCAELEAAAGRLRRDLLPEEGNRLLAALELHTRIHA
jgi:hypothetical protein